MSISF